MRISRFIKLAALALAVAACGDNALEVENPNNPDRNRVLRNPSDVEGLASSQYQQILSATLGAIARVQTGMMTASFENSSTLANNGLGPRSGIPRQPIDNNRGNAYQSENFNDFRLLSSVARNSADILARAKVTEFSLGAGREGDLIRLKAWSHFTYATALGYLSLVYDSAGIARPDDAEGSIPALESYQAVNEYALAQYDSALAYANNSSMTALPAGWLTGPGGVTVSRARFIQVRALVQGEDTGGRRSQPGGTRCGQLGRGDCRCLGRHYRRPGHQNGSAERLGLCLARDHTAFPRFQLASDDLLHHRHGRCERCI